MKLKQALLKSPRLLQYYPTGGADRALEIDTFISSSIAEINFIMTSIYNINAKSLLEKLPIQTLDTFRLSRSMVVITTDSSIPLAYSFRTDVINEEEQ